MPVNFLEYPTFIDGNLIHSEAEEKAFYESQIAKAEVIDPKKALEAKIKDEFGIDLDLRKFKGKDGLTKLQAEYERLQNGDSEQDNPEQPDWIRNI